MMFICFRCRLVRAVEGEGQFISDLRQLIYDQWDVYIIHHLLHQLTNPYAIKPVPPAPRPIRPIHKPHTGKDWYCCCICKAQIRAMIGSLKICNLILNYSTVKYKVFYWTTSKLLNQPQKQNGLNLRCHVIVEED